MAIEFDISKGTFAQTTLSPKAVTGVCSNEESILNGTDVHCRTALASEEFLDMIKVD